MWLLIKIEDLNDLGQHEKERILIHDSDIAIEKKELLKLDIKAMGIKVHPNTLDMALITPHKMAQYLHKHEWAEQQYPREEVRKFTKFVRLNNKNNIEFTAMVPARTDLIDYRRATEIVIDTLASSEKRSAYETVIDISRQATTFVWNGSWEDGKNHSDEVGEEQYYLRMCGCGKRRGLHTGKSRLERDAKCPFNNIPVV